MFDEVLVGCIEPGIEPHPRLALGEQVCPALLGALIPRADVLADIAAVDLIAKRIGDLTGDLAATLCPVGQTLLGVEDVLLVERTRWAGIASDARRIAAEKFADDPEAGIQWLLDEHSAVTEVTLSGVPDWIWVGAIPAGDGVRWRNYVSGWDAKNDLEAKGSVGDGHPNLADERLDQCCPTYAPLSAGWYDGSHEQLELL